VEKKAPPKDLQNGTKKPVFKPKDFAPKPKSSTLIITKIKTADLEGSNSTQQLISERIKLLCKIVSQIGKLDVYDDSNVVLSGFLLATYVSKEEAEKAFKALTRKESLEQIALDLQAAHTSLPKSVLPNLFGYKVDFSDRAVQKKDDKNAYVKKPGDEKERLQKKIVAPPKPKVEKVVVPEKKEKPKVEKVEEKKKEEVVVVPVKENGHSNGHATHHNNHGDAKHLRSEAEKARAQDELKYLASQHSKVASEILAERERCKSREEHIEKLSEDLERIEHERQRLDNQLKAESKWKQVSVERISKLEEELHHIEKEQLNASGRLSGKKVAH